MSAVELQSRSTEGSASTAGLLEPSMRQACRALGGSGAVLWRPVHQDGDRLRAAHVCGHTGVAPGETRSADHGVLGEAVAAGRPVVALAHARFSRPRSAQVTPSTAATEAAVGPIRVDGELWGWLAVMVRPPSELIADAATAFDDASHIVEAVLEQHGRPARDATVSGGAAAFAMLLDLRDGYTGTHVDEVVRWCCSVGRELGLAPAEKEVLRTSAQLHDLGKIGVPDHILHKPGALTDDEWLIMRQHSAWGADALAQVPGFGEVARAVRGHHERWDGRGYPDALAGEAIPFASRVISVADCYHALTSNRPYRGAMSPQDARTLIERGRGTQFDPVVADTLLRVVPTNAPVSVAAPDALASERAAAVRKGERLAAGMKRMDRLPAITESHARMAQLVEEPDPAALVQTVESDVGLALAVLRLANRRSTSADVTGVPEALELLDVDDLRTVLERVPTVDYFQRVSGMVAPLEHFRLHARATQRAARRVCLVLDTCDDDLVLTAALLHDIGKLVLEYAHEGYPADVHGDARTPDDRVRAEQAALGLDHAAVGGLLLRRLGLPNALAEAVERHHTPSATGAAGVLRLADMLAHYVQADAVSPPIMTDAARAIGLETDQLRAIMFELSQDNAVRRATAPSPLTKGETAVLRGLAQGHVYKEIGQELGIAVSTVRSHCHAAYRKLGVNDRAQAVLKATENNWL